MTKKQQNFLLSRQRCLDKIEEIRERRNGGTLPVLIHLVHSSNRKQKNYLKKPQKYSNLVPPANEKNEDLGPIEKKLLGELSSKAQLKKEKLLEKSEQNLHSQNIIRPTTDHNPLIFQSKALDLQLISQKRNQNCS